MRTESPQALSRLLNPLASRITVSSLPLLAALLGGLMTVWAILMAQGVVNHDGVLYIRAAELFAAGQWQQGLALYNWPLYSLLLAGVHLITGLSLQLSGHALAVALYGAASAAFMMVLRELGAARNVMLAGLLLWLSSPYLVGDILPMLVRDHGFWACLLSALWMLLRFSSTWRMKYALGWGVAATFATLFRIEGITFLLLMPLALILTSPPDWTTRFKRLLQAHAVLISCGVALIALLAGHPTLQLSDLGRLDEPVRLMGQFYLQITQGLQIKAERYGDEVLGHFLSDYALPGLLLTLVWALLLKIAGASGLLQTLLFLWTVKNPLQDTDKGARPILAGFALIGLLNAVMILISKQLLPSRMVAPLAFLVMIAAAYALARLFASSDAPAGHWRRLMRGVAGGLLLIQLAASMWPPSGEPEFEIRAIQWLNAQKGPQEKVFYDEARLYHYAGQPFMDPRQDLSWRDIVALFESGAIRDYDYLVIHGDKRKPAHEAYVTKRLGPPQQRFDNGRRSEILIYRVDAARTEPTPSIREEFAPPGK